MTPPDPTRPGHGADATPWPDGSERWGDYRGEGAVLARLAGIEGVLGNALRSLREAEDWAAGWEPAPNITAEVAAARAAIEGAGGKVRGVRLERRARAEEGG